MTLNLTDPTLAPLIARYRAWVEAENKKRAMQYAAYQSRDQQQYEEELAKYKALAWWKKWIDSEPEEEYSWVRYWRDSLDQGMTLVSGQGFLDWCVREGIEAK